MAHAPHPHASDAAALGSAHVAVDEAEYAGARESLASQDTAAGGRRKSGIPRGPSWTPFEQLAALDAYFSACEVVQESREVDRWQHANKQYPHYVRELAALGLWKPSTTVHGARTPEESIDARRCEEVNEHGVVGANKTVFERGKAVKAHVLKVAHVFRRGFRACGNQQGESGKARQDFWDKQETEALKEKHSEATLWVFRYVAPDSPYLDPAAYRTLKERARPEFALRHEDRCTSAANTASRLQQRTAAATARRESVHPITMAPDKSPTRAMREEALERQVIEELRRTNDVLEMMMRFVTQGELQLPARTGSEAPSNAPADEGEATEPIGAENTISAENIPSSVPPVTPAEIIMPHGTTEPNVLCEASAASPVRKRAREETSVLQVNSPTRRSTRERHTPLRLQRLS
ncbi:unnamed product [Ostreococcus tauri]|uniref:Unnamed product n=1 Tax=Ostreococcus tauri TaxID=70448 RepID=A0A096PAH9_OSTTA|nr:unnamed product [Ostreococcus tauri]CEG01929.1 unnamed product [Ostreococcus tauri]|eukprot:XP_022841256.1 unnamed product [Ostreococcus tauri]